jgi:hypothetical protein
MTLEKEAVARHVQQHKIDSFSEWRLLLVQMGIVVAHDSIKEIRSVQRRRNCHSPHLHACEDGHQCYWSHSQHLKHARDIWGDQLTLSSEWNTKEFLHIKNPSRRTAEILLCDFSNACSRHYWWSISNVPQHFEG